MYQYENELIGGFQTAMMHASMQSNRMYRPEFISNCPTTGRKVLVSIEQELSTCEQFKISVAFITKSGITPLLQVLKELEKKGIPGQILTTDYLGFSDPEALDKLASLKNIELRMFHSDLASVGFHTKGYIFKKDELYRIIIGSSNMTASALTRNKEWNTRFVSMEQGEIAKTILKEFEQLWNSEYTQSYEECIEEYRLQFLREKMIRDQRKAAMKEQQVKLERYQLKPNKMQVAFLQNVLRLRKENANKALLTSSTGTGKTFASAFAMRELKPTRLLFLVHRERIAKQAMQSYEMIFGSEITYGLLSGNQKDLDANFLFSTMQMMSKESIYTQFDEDYFDVIVIDECHHAGSQSYQKIMNYFKPIFWLGMTASPDTSNYDIYALFDHNIAYDIRLRQALEEDLLCPFHYFGISDIEIDGEVFDDNTGLQNFKNLVCDQRVHYILEKAEYYGYSGDRVKGLIFCSRKEEAKELSQKFNEMKKPDGSYYRTKVLTGEDRDEYREKVIEQLCSDDNTQAIDYIFTVDIFNEGVDIPEINQVIMLRPTQSSVIFIQQLGRGLRKFEGKEYVVILDFIGNYTNNYMIPIALFDDRSYNKDNMRRYVREGTRMIPGSSTIHFDEVSRTRIFESIDSAKTNDSKLLKDSYLSLKWKLGRIPTILEFKEHGSIDIRKYFEKHGSYHHFLKKYEKDYNIILTAQEEEIIEFMSRKLSSYKRIHEIALLQLVIERKNCSIQEYKEHMKKEYNLVISSVMECSIYRNLANLFTKDSERAKYKDCILIEQEQEYYKVASQFDQLLENPQFNKMVHELLVYAQDQYDELYSNPYKETSFQLYQKYSYEDVCRLLGWEKNMNAQNIGGYFYDKKTKTLPVFINYNKSDDAIAYEDRFVSENTLIALSKHPRRITSSDADHIYKRNEEDKENRIFLFVRKNKDDKEAKEFYFLGEIYAVGEPKAVHMECTKDHAFEIMYQLDVPVRSDIYDYIVKG